MQQSYSIKKRALLLGSLISLSIFILMFFAAYQIAYHETEEILDQKLKNMAEWMADYAPALTSSQFDPTQQYQEEDVFVDVYLKQQIPQQQAKHPILSTVQTAASYYQYQNAGVEFIAYILPLQDRQIQVAQPLEVRRLVAFELAGTMLIPYLLLLPVVFLWLYWGIGRALRPMQNLQEEFSQRQYHDLTRLQQQDYPQELGAIVTEVNALFSRIEQAQQEQNEFITHAAHELRSPLTALNLQIKILEKEYQDSSTIASLVQGVKRLQHMVQQLLDLARQGETKTQASERVSIQQLLKDVVQDLYPLVNEKNIDLALIAPEQPMILELDKHSVLLVLRNLLDNAIKYTPACGTVEVTVQQNQQNTEVWIEDSGAGIDESEYDNIMQKFYRIHNTGVGSGLGLAIVAKSLQRMRAELHFCRSQRLNGLAVCVRFISFTNEESDTFCR
ncbi:MAG: two-component sensor histidine kinase [Acinetobacter sp.]|nr:MAG: two-component sensor histidine kinase [Acinetobacter sp.]